MSLPPDTRPPFVTPEAVVLEFETAGLGSRTFAILIDLVVQTVLGVGAYFALFVIGAEGGGDLSTAGVVVLLVMVVLILLGYPIAWETLWRGRTPGKAALGLRVVTTEGAPVQFRHAVVRGFLTLFDFYATSGAGAVLAVLFTSDNQRLGDLAAGTVVLRERSGARAPSAVAFHPPPGLESYVASLDTTGLTVDDYGAVRSFLVRAPGLPPDVRRDLAEQVADTVVARLSHRPPPSMPAEVYLHCVAAASQQRAGAAATRETVDEWATGAGVWAGVGSRPSWSATPPGEVGPPGPSPAGGYAPPG